MLPLTSRVEQLGSPPLYEDQCKISFGGWLRLLRSLKGRASIFCDQSVLRRIRRLESLADSAAEAAVIVPRTE